MGFSGRFQVRSSLIHGPLNLRENRADLSGHFLALDCRFHSSAIGVTHHQNHLGAQNSGAILQAANHFWRDEISCNSVDIYVPDTLIKYELNRDPRIRTGKYSSERLLLFLSMLLEDREVLFVGDQAPGCKRLLPATNSPNAAFGVSGD
jgi:hypothetical protein